MIALQSIRKPGTIVFHLAAAGRVPLCGDTMPADHLTGWEARGEQRPGVPVTLCVPCQVRADVLRNDGEELTEPTDPSRVRDKAKVQAFRRAAVLGVITAEMARTDANLDYPTFDDYLFDVARYLSTVVEDL